MCARCEASPLVCSARTAEPLSSGPVFHCPVLTFQLLHCGRGEEALAWSLDSQYQDFAWVSFLPTSFELFNLCLLPSLPSSQEFQIARPSEAGHNLNKDSGGGALGALSLDLWQPSGPHCVRGTPGRCGVCKDRGAWLGPAPKGEAYLLID